MIDSSHSDIVIRLSMLESAFLHGFDLIGHELIHEYDFHRQSESCRILHIQVLISFEDEDDRFKPF